MKTNLKWALGGVYVAISERFGEGTTVIMPTHVVVQGWLNTFSIAEIEDAIEDAWFAHDRQPCQHMNPACVMHAIEHYLYREETEQEAPKHVPEP